MVFSFNVIFALARIISSLNSGHDEKRRSYSSVHNAPNCFISVMTKYRFIIFFALSELSNAKNHVEQS